MSRRAGRKGDVEADGAFEASLCAFRQQKIHLDFYCDGKQCGGTQRRLTVDQKPVYDLKLAAQGQALIRPAI